MKYLFFLFYIFLSLLSGLPFNANSQETLDLFILAGQSNAQGWMGDAAFYPEKGKEMDDSILLNWTFVDNESSGSEWVTMQPQKGRFPKGHFGPEVSFARELKKAGFHPAIFKYTKGATGLARDWKAPGEGGIYDSMTTDLKAAINELEKQGLKVNLQAFIWIQGESDAGEEQTANEYYHNLKQLINNLRRTVLQKPDLKIILGVDEQHRFVKERPVVVEAQQKLAEKDSNIIYTTMLDLPKADATHLTPVGLVEHGKRLFKAFTELTTASGENFSVADTLNAIKDKNSNYIVLGDFNAHSPFDANFYNPDSYLINRRRGNNPDEGLNGNIYLNDLDYSVMSSFLAFPLYDVTRDYTIGINERGSFPGRILGPVNNETTEQLVSRLERIDYILVSPELKEKCMDAKVFNGEPNWFLSDHYPIQAKFIFKN